MNNSTQGKISVVINTLNEEENIGNLLRSVCTWVDEIIVVDMYSEDRTVEIAKKYNAKVFYHDRILEFDLARKFAINQATYNWVLLLDADEQVPKQLSLRLIEIVNTDEADVVIMPWLNYMFGSPIMHTGWGPDQDKHERFFKKNMMDVSEKIHSFLVVKSEARILSLNYSPNMAIVHYNYIDFAHHFEKINRYTTIEAYQAFKRGQRSSVVKMLYAATREFIRRYIFQSGFRDGWRGFYLSLNLAIYQIIIFAKLTEIVNVGDREAVKSIYLSKSESLINEYSDPAN